jgi:hypothetical protein
MPPLIPAFAPYPDVLARALSPAANYCPTLREKKREREREVIRGREGRKRERRVGGGMGGGVGWREREIRDLVCYCSFTAGLPFESIYTHTQYSYTHTRTHTHTHTHIMYTYILLTYQPQPDIQRPRSQTAKCSESVSCCMLGVSSPLALSSLLLRRRIHA